MAKFQKGKSGNAAGRPPGTGKVAEIREMIAGHIPEVITQLVKDAKKGDSRASKLLLERYVPAMRAVEMPVELLLPKGESMTAQGEAIVLQVAEGKLSPSQGAALLSGLGNLARVREVEILEERIAALEERMTS